MADNDNSVVVELVLDGKTIKGTFKKLEDDASKAGTSLSSKLTKSASAGFGKLALAAAAAGTAIAAALFSKASIAAAIEQENAIQRLNQSLASAGRFSKEASQRFQDFASEIQKTTTIGDETTLGLVAIANNFARTNDEAEKLTKAAIELSAATGKDLRSSLDLLGKTLSGSAGRLGTELRGFNQLTKEQLKAGEAIDLVLARFGGSAASQVNTFSGSLTQLKNLFGDFQEEIGNVIIKSPILVKSFQIISDIILKATSSFKGLTEGRDIIGELILTVINFGLAIKNTVLIPLEILGNYTKFIFKSILTGVQGLLAGSLNLLNEFVQRLPNLPGIQGIKDTMKEVADASFAAFIESAEESGAALDNILDTSFSDSTESFLIDFKQQLMDAKPVVDDFKNNTVSAFTEIDQEAKKRIDSINQAFSAGLVATVAAGAAQLGQSLANGKLAFQDFAGVILGALGDLSISIGTNLIAQGIGINALASALASLNGAAAIAAGASLVALGAALKAIGKPSPLSTPTVGTPGGSAIASEPIGGEVDTNEAITPSEPSSQISLVIQGDILDSEETGLRIVDILNSAFDKQGTVVKSGVFA